MITCPACGKENEDVAAECKRCRAPLREEAAEGAEPVDEAARAYGTVCGRCDTYNEPGIDRCTACGYLLFAAHAAAAPAEVEPALDPNEDPTAGHTSPELRALAISAEEAAEAMGPTHRPPVIFTPPPEAPAMKRMGALPQGIQQSQRAPGAPPPPAPARPQAQADSSPAAEKPCASCGAMNPPAAKFCFDCGNPFIQKKPAGPLKIEPLKSSPPPVADTPSIEVDAELTHEMAPVEDLPAGSALEDAPAPDLFADETPVDAADAGDPIIEEIPPPFQATLVVEKGASPGAVFTLDRLENRLGADGCQVQITEDPFIAPHAATLLFAEDRLFVRDEGSANGIFVKVRETAPLHAGDLFVAGERMLRYDGPVEVPAAEAEGDTPLLGAPRQPGPLVVRIVEVLLGGKTGRVCHRSGPTIGIGRTGCDLNFPADSLLGARHAEVRVAEDGSALLVDLGQGASGVYVRIRPQQTFDLQAGDVLQAGDQQLRLEII